MRRIEKRDFIIITTTATILKMNAALFWFPSSSKKYSTGSNAAKLMKSSRAVKKTVIAIFKAFLRSSACSRLYILFIMSVEDAFRVSDMSHYGAEYSL